MFIFCDWSDQITNGVTHSQDISELKFIASFRIHACFVLKDDMSSGDEENGFCGW